MRIENQFPPTQDRLLKPAFNTDTSGAKAPSSLLQHSLPPRMKVFPPSRHDWHDAMFPGGNISKAHN